MVPLIFHIFSIFFYRTFIYLGVQTMWQKLQHRLMTYTSLVWVRKELVSSLSFFCQDNLTVNTGILATHSKKLHPSSAIQILGKNIKNKSKKINLRFPHSPLLWWNKGVVPKVLFCCRYCFVSLRSVCTVEYREGKILWKYQAESWESCSVLVASLNVHQSKIIYH